MNSEKDKSNNLDVLVVAPIFPSINQPWMDTYIEQLQLNHMKFIIVSAIRSASRYHKKVDRLGLLDYVVPVIMEKRQIFCSAAAFATRQPSRFLALSKIAWLIFNYEPPLLRLKTMLRALHCAYCFGCLKQVKVIHSHSELFGCYFLPLAIYRQVPMIITFHGLEPYGLQQLSPVRRRMLSEYVHRIIVNTQAAKQQVVALGYPTKKIIILPQGLPLEDFPFAHRSAPQKGKTLHLLTIGRYHRDKGQAYALIALRRLVTKGIEVYWHFVGAGPEKERLANLAQKLHVEGRVTFHMALDLVQIRELYKKCHLFVLPSLSNHNIDELVETQGVVLQEAQACGCIPIATRVGGIPECVHDRKDALLIQDRSHKEIADAIWYMLQHPEIWRSYQREGRRNVEKKFPADIIGKRMAKVLSEIINKSLYFQ